MIHGMAKTLISSSYLKPAGMAIIVAAAVLAVRHWFMKNVAKFEQDAKERLLDDILDALAPQDSGRESLKTKLSKMIFSGEKPLTPVLASIMRVEESFEKRSGDKYLRRVSILRRKEDAKGSLAKIESEISWEYLPEAVRAEFIKTRSDKVARRIYDSGKDTD